MNYLKHTSRRALPVGFTLTELLIVISIMVLLFTVAVPSLKNLLNAGKVEQGLNVIGSGVSSVRTYAGLSPSFQQGSYQGVAALFTPANEIRIVQHNADVKNGSGTPLIQGQQAGYVDVGQGYIQLPSGTGVVGLARLATGSEGSPPLLLAPPFAVRFDPSGNLIVNSTSITEPYALVYYDGNGDGKAVESSKRTNPYASGAPSPATTYTPEEWDPTSTKYRGYDDTSTKAGIYTNASSSYHGKYKLPFEEIETVVGVIVFDKAQLLAVGLNLNRGADRGVNDNARDWILENGTPVFFSRYSGARIKP